MSANEVFVAALAEAVGRPVEVSAEVEATTLGAGFLAGMAVGTWRDEDDVAAASGPAAPGRARRGDAERPGGPAGALAGGPGAGRARTIPELSGIDF